MANEGIDIGAPERAAQASVIELFDQTLGYEYLGNKTDTENYNICTDLLWAYLDGCGCPRKVADAAISKFQAAANDLSQGLYAANKAVYELLKYGVKVPDGHGGITTVYLINFDEPEKNDFQFAEEVTVNGFYDKRPDIVVYVNGIALGVIELKRGSVSVMWGICQNIANQEHQFIRPFFTTMQLVTAGNPSEGLRYGTILTPAKYYLEWHHDGYGKFQDERDPNDVRLEQESVQFGGEKLLAQISEMFDKTRFLDLIRNFVIFDKGIKKLCRSSQYFGIKRALRRIGKNKGGIIWHSQGSGKSLTMVWLAKHVLEANPDGRVLIVTDREELDEQIEKLFIGVGEKEIVRAKSCKSLINGLNDPAGGSILCSLIHKFGHQGMGEEESSEKDYEKYIEELKASLPEGFEAKGEFTVFVDECHRTQSGLLHQAMKAILPNAVFIGFTGTPLLKKDKQTSLEVFGDYIHTYKFQEAVRDGVILDLRYEARDVPQDVTAQEQIDKWFEAKTQGLTAKAKATLKERWATMQNVVSSKSRLAKIVEDIILDFATKPRLMDGHGNAILVAEDILTACKFYTIFRDHGFGKCAVISSYVPTPGDINTDIVNPYQKTDAQIKYETYCKMIGVEDGEDVRSIASKVEKYEQEAKRMFVEEPANMQLLIVVDKLLTGFDAPPCTYLYIDKHMQDHGLFQAICRVNRLDDDSKDFGYIVDYQKLFGNLEAALGMYTGSGFGGFDADDVEGFVKNVVKESNDYFVQTLATLDALCEGVEPPQDGPAYRSFFGCQGGDTPEEEEAYAQRREKMYRLVTMLARAYAAFKPRMAEAGVDGGKQAFYEERVRFYLELRKDIGQASGDFLDLKPYEPDMRYLIDTYIAAGESERLEVLKDFTLIDFIDEKAADDEKKPMTKKEKDAVAETIENNATKELVQKRLVNPAFYERMSQVLKKLIEDRKAGVLEYRQLLEEYKKLAEQLAHPETTGAYPASIGLNAVMQALYDNFGQDEALTLALHKAFLGSRLSGFRYSTARMNKIKQALYDVLKDEDKVEAVYKILEAQED